MRTKLRQSESSVKTLRISISQAVPGMMAAVDVYTFNNQLIIAKGTKLTDTIITRLKFYSVTDLNILSEDVMPQPSLALKKKQPIMNRLKIVLNLSILMRPLKNQLKTLNVN